jgi:hypothetical protein
MTGPTAHQLEGWCDRSHRLPAKSIDMTVSTGHRIEGPMWQTIGRTDIQQVPLVTCLKTRHERSQGSPAWKTYLWQIPAWNTNMTGRTGHRFEMVIWQDQQVNGLKYISDRSRRPPAWNNNVTVPAGHQFVILMWQIQSVTGNTTNHRSPCLKALYVRWYCWVTWVLYSI